MAVKQNNGYPEKIIIHIYIYIIIYYILYIYIHIIMLTKDLTQMIVILQLFAANESNSKSTVNNKKGQCRR